MDATNHGADVVSSVALVALLELESSSNCRGLIVLWVNDQVSAIEL